MNLKIKINYFYINILLNIHILLYLISNTKIISFQKNAKIIYTLQILLLYYIIIIIILVILFLLNKIN